MLTHPPSMEFLIAFNEGAPVWWDNLTSPFYLAHLVGTGLAFLTGAWMLLRAWKRTSDGPYRQSIAWIAGGLAIGMMGWFLFGFVVTVLNIHSALAFAPLATIPSVAFGARALSLSMEHARIGWTRVQEAKNIRQESVSIAIGGLTTEIGGALSDIATRCAIAAVTPPSGRAATTLFKDLERRSRDAERRLTHVARAVAPDAEPTALDVVPLLDHFVQSTDLFVDENLNERRFSGEAHSLQRAVQALVSNANDAGCGRPRLRAVYLPSAVIPATAIGEDIDGKDVLMIELCDNGSGMTAEVLQRCLEPYFSTRDGRRGLGLVVVMQAARIARGALNVESSQTSGTCVRLYLPEVDPLHIDWVAQPEQHIDAPTVLLLDADAPRAELLKDFLQTRGVTVLSAESGGRLRRNAANTTFGGPLVLCVQRPVRGEDAALAIAVDRGQSFADVVVVCDLGDPLPSIAHPLTRPVSPPALAAVLAEALVRASNPAAKSGSP